MHTEKNWPRSSGGTRLHHKKYRKQKRKSVDSSLAVFKYHSIIVEKTFTHKFTIKNMYSSIYTLVVVLFFPNTCLLDVKPNTALFISSSQESILLLARNTVQYNQHTCTARRPRTHRTATLQQTKRGIELCLHFRKSNQACINDRYSCHKKK